jgi:Flp pilus assembly protein TadD
MPVYGVHIPTVLRVRRGFDTAATARRSWLALGLIVLLAGCVPSEVKRDLKQFSGTVIDSPGREAVLAEPRKNVVTVLALDANGRAVGYGSGFFVRSNQVVTCLHVIEVAHQLKIELADGSLYFVAGVYATDPLMDAAVLWITDPQPSAQPLRLRQRPAQLREAAYALGTSDRLDGLPISASKGTVLQVLESGSELMNSSLVLSVPVLPGFSGGPVLDVAGEVIGMTGQIAATARERTSVAVPVEFIRPLCEGQPMDWTTWRQRFPAPHPEACAEVAAGELLGTGNAATALRHFERALEIAPGYVRAWVRKASCLTRLGRIAEAVTSYQQALKLEPGMVMPRVRLVACLVEEKQPEEALREARQVREMRPQSVASHLCLVSALMANGDLAVAMTTARDAVRLAPTDPLAQEMMGQLWDRAGCPAKAETNYHRAARLNADGVSLRFQTAVVQLEQGALDQAAESLKRVLESPAATERSGAEYFLAAIALGRGRRDEAASHHKNFIAAETDQLRQGKATSEWSERLARLASADPGAATTHLELAGYFEQTGRFHERLAAMETAVLLAPEDFRVWTALARAGCQTWRYERALEASQRAIALKPNAQAYRTLGIACAALGRLGEARVAMVKAVALGGCHPDDLLGLASVEAKAGRVEVAHEYVTEALQRNPKLPRKYELAPETLIPDAERVRAGGAE